MQVRLHVVAEAEWDHVLGTEELAHAAGIGDVDVCTCRCACLLRVGKPREALMDAVAVLQTDEDNIKAHFRAGQAHLALKVSNITCNNQQSTSILTVIMFEVIVAEIGSQPGAC